MDYLLSFYGIDGLYPLGMTKSEAFHLVCAYCTITGRALEEIDSVDRERIRDMYLIASGKK